VVTRRVGDLDYMVARSDRGRGTQIYHLNLLKLWNEERPVCLAMSVIEESELGPEAQNAVPFTPVLSEGHLTPGQRTEVAELQQRFADVFSPARPHRTHQTPPETPPGVSVNLFQ